MRGIGGDYRSYGASSTQAHAELYLLEKQVILLEAKRQSMSIVHAFTVNVARLSVGSRSPQDPIVSSFCVMGISAEPSSQHSSVPLTCSGFEYERGASEMLGCISHRSLLYC